MSKGKPAKPLAVLKLDGQYRADRHDNKGPQDGGTAPRKPDGLGDHGSAFWDMIVRNRTPWLAESDGELLESLCVAWQYMKQCRLVLDKDATNKDARCSYTAYQAIVNQLAARFGLTPSDRARLGENQAQNKKDDELEELIG